MRPLALPPRASAQEDFNRRVSVAINLLRLGVIPEGAAVPYNGATPPDGWVTAAPGPTLSAGWIWITPGG